MEKMLHAYILTGGEREALLRQAVETAALAECERPVRAAPCGSCRHCRKVFQGIHPDVIRVERETDRDGKLRRDIVVGQVRRMEADAAVLPNEGERKVYILREAELMNDSAQNAFLKLLEEPPAWVLFLLCTENPALLLPTIRSRCATLRTGGSETALSPEAREQALEYLRALGSRTQLLRCCAKLEKMDVAETRAFVEAVRLTAPELLQGAALLELERELEQALEYLRFHVSAKHVMGMLATYEMRE